MSPHNRLVLALVLAASGGAYLGCKKTARRPAPSPSPTHAALADASVPVPTPDADTAQDDLAAGKLCSDDGDCGWDDPCNASRCQRVKGQAPVACDKSRPPPGTCSCVNHRCTLHPDGSRAAAPTPAPACGSSADCAIDLGAGTCVLGGRPSGPIITEGPICTCTQGSCQFSWSAPVPCQSFKDCSLTREPRLRPVPSSEVPRELPRPVRPCKDGERDSVCGDDGLCHIVAWSC
ncbi:MAG: hypothetical protein IT370_24855 [Deltaproteobacteria bacterium]|nr:hypothetical protein [Deltaproteobacteria bacterium]